MSDETEKVYQKLEELINSYLIKNLKKAEFLVWNQSFYSFFSSFPSLFPGFQ